MVLTQLLCTAVFHKHLLTHECEGPRRKHIAVLYSRWHSHSVRAAFLGPSVL